MGGRLPDFLIIGAMKCGTSTLHEQLARRSGLYMSTPKEPNFFSDDDQYAHGLDWYCSLFEKAREDQLCGESSTHYTKLPSHPLALERMTRHLAHPRLIYLMRDPLERIVSQYIHEWSQRDVREDFETAVRGCERYVAYSSYARQLEPYLRHYGEEAVLPVFVERLEERPDEELARICAFLRDPSREPVRWDAIRGRENVSRERLRRSALRDALLALAPIRAVKDRVPRAWRERVKANWQMRDRPHLSETLRAEIEPVLDADLKRLGSWLGIELSCAAWRAAVRRVGPSWVAKPLPR